MSDVLGRLDEPPAPVPRLAPGSSQAAAVAAAALAEADAAATAAGVVVREAGSRAELTEVCDLLAQIWQERPDDRAQTPVMLRAFSHSGNYVGTARAGNELVGACVGFFGLADGWELHSHIAGVAGRVQGRSVGFALKAHQRAWALTRGLGMISWTFDPLIRRNAYFNLCKLAARPRLYIPDFYGEMVDGINTGDRSDRLVVEWPLRATEVAEACAGSAHEFDASGLLAAGAGIALEEDARGRPRRHAVSNRFVLVNPPADIERLRVDDPVIARVWRYDLRHVLLGLLDQGARIIGFSRRDGYILDRAGA